jgi:hypothetical protein
MNIEELKLILETISGVADGATDMVLWWIVLHYGGSLLVHLAWIVLLGCIAFGGLRFIASMSDWIAAGREVAEAGGAPNANFGPMNRSDREAIKRVLNAFRQLKETK